VATDGCEVNINTDPAHCSSCANVCPARANATPTCTAGTCGYSCSAGFGDCNGLVADGCEVDFLSTTHCGTCLAACSDPTPLCQRDSVTGPYTCVGSCVSPDVQCGTICANTATDPEYCGSCGNGCTASQTCITGSCRCGHRNGSVAPLGQTYIDCSDPLGTPGTASTYNLNMATLACAAYTGNASQCGASACGAVNVVCDFTAPFPSCTCWTFSGLGAGTAIYSTTISMGQYTCSCALVAGANTWN
jgi:hypothetical protein